MQNVILFVILSKITERSFRMFDIVEIANAIRNEKLTDEQIHKKFGGFSIYIPKVDPRYQEKILKQFNGYNHAQLATKFNIAVNTVYKVIRESKPKQTTLELF